MSRITSHFSQWGLEAVRRGIDLLLPPHCAFCGNSQSSVTILSGVGVRFCGDCLSDFAAIGRPCPQCAAPLPPLVDERSGCFRCRKRNYRFDSVTAGGRYEGYLRHAVLQLKAGRQLAIGHALGQWLAARWVSEFGREIGHQMVIPMPSHWRRRWSRGCNPAEELARPIATILGIPLAGGALRVTRAPAKQGTLTPNQRFENVRRLFRVSRGYALAGRNVLLVDDVLTTGATASEAARMLRRAGAARVDVLVAARGVGE